jgi:hypothetical protein
MLPPYCPPADLQACIDQVMDRARHRLQERTGSERADLRQSSENLAKMYELNAPASLIKHAHQIQNDRLRQHRKQSRAAASSVSETPPVPRQKLTVIDGGKI